MGNSRYRMYGKEYPYFLTDTIAGLIPAFSSRPFAEIVIDSLRFLQTHGRLEIYAYVLMENHMHLIASADDLAKEMGDLKSYTARKIIDHLEEYHARYTLKLLRALKPKHKTDREYRLWDEGSYPKQIQNREMMRQKVAYIHQNPVKRGYVDEAIHWRYSSARNYAGLPGLLDVKMDW